jgi:hypothetical protein
MRSVNRMQNNQGQEDLPSRPSLLNSELKPIADRAMFWAEGHGEMASLVECSLYHEVSCAHGVLSSDPQDKQEKPSTAAHIYKPSPGEVETGESPRLQSS